MMTVQNKIIAVLGMCLFISLSANAFMGGMLVGGYSKDSPDYRQQDSRLRDHLTETDRQVVKAAMEKARPELKDMRQKLKDARQAVEEAQNAQPFDQARLDAALANQQRLREDMKGIMSKSRSEIMKNMSPEGQEAFRQFQPFAGEEGHRPMRQQRGPFLEKNQQP